MKAKHFFYFLLFTFYLLSCKTPKPVMQQHQAIQAIPTPTITTQNTTITLPSLLSDSNLNNAHVGIYIYEPATKKVIDKYQSNKYFIPASNTKIATCYAAMKYLGDSILGLMYREINDSTITIQGVGDPTFLHKDFKQQLVFDFLKGIKNKNIFLSEQSDNNFRFINYYGKGWAIDDSQETFMPQRSFFPMYGNLATFYLDNDTVKVMPNFFQKSVNQWYKKIKAFGVEKGIYKNVFFIRDYGKLTTNQLQIPFSLDVELRSNSIIHNLLADTLHSTINLEISHFTEKNKNNNKNKIYSQPTDSLLKPMMYNSDNFFAEQTLLMVSLNQLGYMGDEQIIDTLLKKDFNDLPQKPRWVDGSGLSRYNLFTPQDFVFILNKMKQEYSWQRVSTIFPTANQGTLKGYYKNYENKIFAKTGSVSNNFSISGFIKTNSGKDFIFSVMINNYNNVSSGAVRLAIEKYLSQIIDNN